MDPQTGIQPVPAWGPGRLLQPASTASPLDYMKASVAAADRAVALGLTPTRLSDSFGGNQSFPRSSLTAQQMARRLESPSLARCTGEGGATLNWSLVSGAGGGRGGARLLHSPAKAWAVLSAEGGQVLISNSVLSSLLGYTDTELRSVRLWDLVIRRTDDTRPHSLDQLELDPESGETLACSGRVVRLVHQSGDQVAVSLTVRKLADSSRLMVLMEPVTRTLGHLRIQETAGNITEMDPGAEAVFQVRGVDYIGCSVERLLPGLKIPGPEIGSRSRQCMVGHVCGEGEAGFPVSCLVTRIEGEPGVCSVTVWVYSSLSGLILLDGGGVITQCDPVFSSLVLGHSTTSLEGRRIDEVIPGFYDEFEVPSCDKTDEDLGCGYISPSLEAAPELLEDSNVSPLEEICLNSRPLQRSAPGSPLVFKPPPPSIELRREEKENEDIQSSPIFKRPSSLCVRTPVKVPMDQLTSTPACKTRPAKGGNLNRSKHERSLDDGTMPNGCFYGLARHCTGAEISVLYQVKRVVLKTGSVVYCVWVTRDSEEVGTRTLGLTLPSSSLPSDLGEREEPSVAVQQQQPAVHHWNLDTLTAGAYSSQYGTLDQIGQGAFGCVRLSYRLEDRQLLVTKFIVSSKVHPECWVEGEKGEKLPFEVSLLLKLSHPGIVRVLDVFQNSSFVQMVMEKHGDMDLFEFIDRNPIMDEPLASLIFRQVVSAVEYLHARNILHRDVKDENIIIDHRFNCKLIDFGSAVFFESGQTFHTFYGTVEYCSPEVLQGCAYNGPELEMWSMGVLLYIIIFGENPFYDPQDTIRAELHPPHNDVSTNCWELIQALLDKDPSNRASLWHVKEHQWVCQEVDPDQYQLYDVIPCTEAELRPPTHYREEGCGGRVAARAGETGRPFLSQCSAQHDSIELSSLETNLSTVSSSGVEYSNLMTTMELDQAVAAAAVGD